jgi:isoleucyl-tRNA synthetase
MFQPASANANLPRQEEEILQFWKERGIFDKSVEQRRQKNTGRFVFYEGPPTANGMPHPGHCLTRAIKDLFPRYQTMRGKLCERKAGWDTHGLPVEVEVCKELGIHSKEEIENYGVEPFIHRCQESVWRYMKQWERMTERLGFWIHLDDAYVTYHQSYVESVWWSLKNLFDRGLLYQGHKIVWWWAQGGTALSSGEVGQGYREVADPSVYVLFPLLDDGGNKTDTSLLVWTTTPWTLPSNQFAAVHPDLEYSVFLDPDLPAGRNKLIMSPVAAQSLWAHLNKREEGHRLVLLETKRGRDLVGRRYVPPFNYYYQQRPYWGSLTDANKHRSSIADEDEFGANGPCAWLRAWRIEAADFVTTDSGTGIVHIAPAFGEVDFNLLQRVQYESIEFVRDVYVPGLLNPVRPDGTFGNQVPDYEGRWVKDCDKDITRRLRDEGKLYHQEQYIHDYPFCWRAEEDPLIQYPRKSWFIRTTQFKDEMLANNEQINWLPEHIKHGRFGNFLETNVDWALSRERYWGTPLPIWVCEQTGKMEAVASYDELLAKPGMKGREVWEAAKKAKPSLPDDLRVHKPYIDEITYDSPFAAGARMNRVSEVIDCWYDSGVMPFAQWGYPHAGADKFKEQFPADFISEALDQTRGWFYSQLAISTMLFGPKAATGTAAQQWSSRGLTSPYPHPFRNCIVLGLMLGEDGQKMSKSKRNYREPSEIFDKYGADALRWFFFANQPPWTTIRYAERAIKDSIPEFLLRLWNCYTFFVIYANIDGFDPRTSPKSRPAAERSEIDRWILSELNRTCAAVVERMDQYDNFEACKRINEFIDGLSNWYVRRSRDRFWAADKQSAEKLDAYWTLYECLTTTCKLIAPFTPFIAETMWRNLAQAPESVHLCDYPTGDPAAVDQRLSDQMKLLREIASLGLSARMANKLKVRQPLAKVEVILSDTTHQKWLEEHDELLRDELNVKKIEYTKEAEKYITYQVQPNFKRLGPRIGKLLPGCKAALGKADGGKLLAELTASGKVTLDIGGEEVELDNEDIQVRLQAKPGWAAAQGSNVVVILATELTPELVAEGWARDFIRLIQDRRKEMELDFTDRIEIGLVGTSPNLRKAIEQFREYISGETLAVKLQFEALSGADADEVEIGDDKAKLSVRRA